ncbi:uncharacterized protein BDR25DRAFT_28406 [Lindgomyces ingoldianus]|uniref:Uncharacterized protein n=1 Tax=Lindgomyces ingoldianus TaxID=673940 RepID=A0ACB6QXY6_9PLEO|nr:uncharacterized protein BDR25DRAFT_28406 [Lindgomyces ingoldianus]KAF2470945.1 hypothetical protein BDR25DRAFT_28406 [Lindgomyces ingoldianus]
MHRKHQISALVYSMLYPSPSPTDPPNFAQHLAKFLVGEVRIETATFYGSLDTIEARYPGLNYAHAPHRKRLGRFPHHKKLFEAFDKLGLTESEIQGFCRWEGTLWARERYERDEGVHVRDTTGMEIGEWVDRRKHRISARNKSINVKTDIEVEIEEVPPTEEMIGPQQTVAGDTEMRDEDDESDEEDESVGFELNQRLLHAAAMREQGVNVAMDPEWEDYLKEAQERGELNIEATQEALRTMAAQLANVNQPDSSQSYEPPAAPA